MATHVYYCNLLDLKKRVRLERSNLFDELDAYRFQQQRFRLVEEHYTSSTVRELLKTPVDICAESV